MIIGMATYRLPLLQHHFLVLEFPAEFVCQSVLQGDLLHQFGHVLMCGLHLSVAGIGHTDKPDNKTEK